MLKNMAVLVSSNRKSIINWTRKRGGNVNFFNIACYWNFRNSFALEQSVPYVGESRATVYLEQLILVENLKKIGHLDLAFIARTNFITLTYLKQLGFLDESQLISEINIARDVIWPRIKDRYTLEPAQV